MEIGNLAKLRCAACLTQTELALASGVSKDTISKIETSSRKSAHALTAKKLAVALDVDLSAFASHAATIETSPAVGRSLANPAGGYYSRAQSAVAKRIEQFDLSKELGESELDVALAVCRVLAEQSNRLADGAHTTAAESESGFWRGTGASEQVLKRESDGKDVW